MDNNTIKFYKTEDITNKNTSTLSENDVVFDKCDIKGGIYIGNNSNNPICIADKTEYPTVTYFDANMSNIVAATILPNILYKTDVPLDYINVILGEAIIPNILDEYMLEFPCNNITQLTISTNGDANIVWQNDDKPDMEDGYTYQISIVNNYACYAKFQTP